MVLPKKLRGTDHNLRGSCEIRKLVVDERVSKNVCSQIPGDSDRNTNDNLHESSQSISILSPCLFVRVPLCGLTI